jgi:hypothetical protein
MTIFDDDDAYLNRLQMLFRSLLVKHTEVIPIYVFISYFHNSFRLTVIIYIYVQQYKNYQIRVYDESRNVYDSMISMMIFT